MRTGKKMVSEKGEEKKERKISCFTFELVLSAVSTY